MDMHTSSADFLSTRGPAKHFHGRKKILRTFGGLLGYSTQNIWGTIFLIQGAPGVGRTALFHECVELAKSAKWKIVKINPSALWNPDDLVRCLEGKNLNIEHGSEHTEVSDIGQTEISAKRWSPMAVEILLQEEKVPLLLTLEDAQILGRRDLIPPDQIHTIVNVLKVIHNGELTNPVVLLSTGLWMAVDAFEELAISRFANGCLVELGALEEEVERAVLHDWLTKDGGVTEDPTPWIDAIAQETHGWPQHILLYVESALNQLRVDKGVMTAEGLHAVLEAGSEAIPRFHEYLIQDFSSKECRSLAKLFANIPLGESWGSNHIIRFLEEEYGSEKAKDIFQQTLQKGILYRRRGDYTIPIPSFQTWLVSKYGRV